MNAKEAKIVAQKAVQEKHEAELAKAAAERKEMDERLESYYNTLSTLIENKAKDGRFDARYNINAANFDTDHMIELAARLEDDGYDVDCKFFEKGERRVVKPAHWLLSISWR